MDEQRPKDCLLYTSDAADERSSVDLGGRRIIKKKTQEEYSDSRKITTKYHLLAHDRTTDEKTKHSETHV